MPVLPSDVPSGRIVGDMWLLDEDSLDAGQDMDAIVPLGTIRFKCDVKQPIRIPGKPLTVVPLVFDAKINAQGRLVPVSEDGDGIQLVATDSGLTDPSGFTWTVSFDLLDPRTNTPVVVPSFSFQVPTGSTQDLATIWPVSSEPGTITIKGPKGDQGDPGTPGAPGAPGNKQQTIDAMIADGFMSSVNELTNPSFETNTTSWIVGGGTLSRQTGSAPAWVVGTSWGRVTSNGTSRWAIAKSTGNAVTPGTYVAFAATMDNNAGSVSRVELQFQPGGQQTIGTTVARTGQRDYVVALVPAGATSVDCAITMTMTDTSNVPSGYLLNFDATQLVSGATEIESRSKIDYGYHDGDTVGSYWQGTAHASKSVRALVNRVPTLLANGVDFNTLMTPGRYRFNNLTGSTNGPAMSQMYGELEVVYSDWNRAVQTVYPTASQAGGKAIYQRANSAGVWGSWGVYVSIVVDTTAGRNVQIYDYVSNSQRTIYGKTGLRNMNGSLINGWTIAASNNLTISRTGDMVTVMATGLVATNRTSDLFFILPPGFRPDHNSTRGFWTNENTAYGKMIGYTNGELYISGSTTALTNVGFGLVFETADAWPTTLPGV